MILTIGQHSFELQKFLVFIHVSNYAYQFTKISNDVRSVIGELLEWMKKCAFRRGIWGGQPTLRSPTSVCCPATSVRLPIEHWSPLEKKTALSHFQREQWIVCGVTSMRQKNASFSIWESWQVRWSFHYELGKTPRRTCSRLDGVPSSRQESRHEKNIFSFCRGGKKDQRMVTAHLEVSLVFLLIIWARKSPSSGRVNS